MIHIAVRKNDVLGPEGLRRIIGLEKSDLETLAKDGILEFSTPQSKFAIMFIKVSREEFLAEIKRHTGEVPVADGK